MPESKQELLYKERLQTLAVLSFDVVESLLTDTETPIDYRLNTAFRIVEMCTADIQKEVGQAVIRSIEHNASGIKQNAQSLAHIDQLLNEQKDDKIMQNADKIAQNAQSLAHIDELLTKKEGE